ncbi:hypothetical protein RvY_19036 [Ramazzottius varieornatus]|uniref:Uncharacterized protein n=1 Tax=Ramazzottius varieornatus TaxID=947166 RepID=A0A1D1WBG1_RAMVA|nr:hypothetical protein RvY_19036 [Ramazzottius varieornatus]
MFIRSQRNRQSSKMELSWNIFTILSCLVFASVYGADQAIRQPSEADLFAPLMSAETDWSDILYVCDFYKTLTYACNVTQTGAGALKNKPVKPSTIEVKLPKFVIQNVTGTWKTEDGLMKSNYVTVDYMDIVAKCFFRTSYYECFGVPRCDGGGAMSACHGGEPWRGSFHGAPNTGFTGNVTAMAMESPASPLSDEPMPSESQQPQAFRSVEFPNSPSQTQFFNLSGPGPKSLLTITNSSGTFTFTGPLPTQPLTVPANGSLSFVQVHPLNSSDGSTSGISVSSFASFNAGNNKNVLPESPNFSFGGPGGLFGGLSGLGSLFGPSSFGGLGSASSESPRSDFGPSSTGIGQNKVNDSCESPSDGMQYSQSLNCLIQNFQKRILSSVMNSFTFPPFGSSPSMFQPMQMQSFGSALPARSSIFGQSQSQSQSQNLGLMSQSQEMKPEGGMARSFMSSPRNGFGGYQVYIVPDNQVPMRSRPSSSMDDMMSWLMARK